jgi:hypothetical protein
MISEEAVSDLCIVATPKDLEQRVRERVDRLSSMGVDELVLVPVSTGNSTAEVATQVDLIAESYGVGN